MAVVDDKQVVSKYNIFRKREEERRKKIVKEKRKDDNNNATPIIVQSVGAANGMGTQQEGLGLGNQGTQSPAAHVSHWARKEENKENEVVVAQPARTNSFASKTKKSRLRGGGRGIGPRV